MSSSTRAEEMIEAAALDEAQQIRDEFAAVRVLCGSPIEELLLAALISTKGHFQDMGVRLWFYKRSFEFPRDPIAPFGAVDLILQAQIGPYRVDFLFDDHSIDGKRQLIVVECDGHDFHERTKEQARHDKKRDRYFAAMGYRVLRFTGSEIYANAAEVAEEICEHLGWGMSSGFNR